MTDFASPVQGPARTLPGAVGVGAPLPSTRPALNWQWIVIGVCVALTVYIAVVPLGFLLWQSFFTPQTATKAAVFTFGNYITAYTNPDTLRRVHYHRAGGQQVHSRRGVLPQPAHLRFRWHQSRHQWRLGSLQFG